MPLLPLKFVQDSAGNVGIANGPETHWIGAIADVREFLRSERLNQFGREEMLRAIIKRLVAAGRDPRTATLAQIRTAIESQAVDV